MDDHFPPRAELTFVDGEKRQTLVYKKVTWVIDNVEKGLRYGENPGQEAALYKLQNGNLVLGGVESIRPRRALASDPELLQAGKHPGKINITDVDNALNILRYLHDRPACVIVKHNNPCGSALGDSVFLAYEKAFWADRLAAFGGAVALNRPVDKASAEAIVDRYTEVLVAPDFEEGVVQILSRKKDLRVMRITAMEKLNEFARQRFLDIKSLMDGGLALQWSYLPAARTQKDFLPARCEYKGRVYEVKRSPTEAEYRDLIFGWLVEAGVTSNSVLYVRDEVTVGIGTGEQDRVGVAQIAKNKAYTKLADRLCFQEYGVPYNTLDDVDRRAEIDAEVARRRGGLLGAVMISDAFFPFRDGVDVGLAEGVTAVVQPGGSVRDYEVIEAVNDVGAAMVFTGQRSFKH
jgi:phosphoribosylaminoimidazolecarboxamide formyltransferase/IMP cyclohydrolase